jgi:hypothetical protein
VLGLSYEERLKLQEEAIAADDREWERERDAENKARAGINEKALTNPQKDNIISVGGENMNILPRFEEAVIPVDKFLKHSLNLDLQPDKAVAFNSALGYNQENAGKLIENIKANLENFHATPKGDAGFGMKYEVIMVLTGENGKTANVLTAWIDDRSNSEMRLTSAYIDKKKGEQS